jgi:hypothetical protein
MFRPASYRAQSVMEVQGVKRRKKHKSRGDSEESMLSFLQREIPITQQTLDWLRSTIRDFPQTADERKKKLAELELERQPHLEKVRTRVAEISRTIQYWEEAKAKLIAKQKALGFFGFLSRDWMAPAEIRKRIEDLDDNIARWTRKRSEEGWELWHPPRLNAYSPGDKRGYSLDDEGFEKLKKHAQVWEELLAYQKAEHAKLAVVVRKNKNKLLAKYGADEATIAAAAAHFGKTRDLADRIKIALRAQLDGSPNCPYCGLPLGDAIHADHIYPVSKGGLSTTENMVLICEQCNLKKGAKTLREFIRENNFDTGSIESALELLGKRF